jgi:hypothetical protein
VRISRGVALVANASKAACSRREPIIGLLSSHPFKPHPAPRGCHARPIVSVFAEDEHAVPKEHGLAAGS